MGAKNGNSFIVGAISIIIVGVVAGVVVAGVIVVVVDGIVGVIIVVVEVAIAGTQKQLQFFFNLVISSIETSLMFQSNFIDSEFGLLLLFKRMF